ncbi:SprT-like domain-containing protein [Nostoc sp. CHAB 5834]|nr:SprT-like domain-containing protein [Nostoc sp. CHAB 5834]
MTNSSHSSTGLPREIEFSKVKAPPVAAGLKTAAKEALAKFVKKAADMGVNLPMPTVSFDLRGTVGGQAFLSKNHVRINAVLFTENVDEFLHQIIPHEVAHLVANRKFGKNISPHGEEWQRVMKAFGLDPKRTHSLDISNARVNQNGAVYRCRCGPVDMRGTRLTKAKAGLLYCLRCMVYFQFTGVLKGRNGEVTMVSQPSSDFIPVPENRVPASKKVVKLRLYPPPRKTTTGATPPPRAPTPELPTEAMLSFALSLAKRLQIAMPSDAHGQRQACSSFIEYAKGLAAPAPKNTDAPTDKQVSYATSIACKKGEPIPPAVLNSRRLLSAWIDSHR